MWPDNETDRDFLNFTGVADTVAEIVVQAEGRPISIGMSGAWGIGKSSMIKLVRRSLEQRRDIDRRDFVFVEFNAWLYQGYDDARAALMEVIGDKLSQEAKTDKKGRKKYGHSSRGFGGCGLPSFSSAPPRLYMQVYHRYRS